MECAMLSLQDLLDFRDLDAEESPAAAPADVFPESVATLSETLLGTREGLIRLHGMMLDNMRHAIENGHKDRLVDTARTFLRFHESYTLPFLAEPAAN
jgi:hypothetical protein